jgi:hypothetical protein
MTAWFDMASGGVAADALTVNVALLLVMPEREADILDVPATTPVATPVCRPMVATLVLLLAQVTEAVIF